MEGSVEGHNLVPSGMEGSQFEGVFVGLGAGIHQEEAPVLVAAGFAQFTGQALLQGVVDTVGIEPDLVQLVFQGCHIVGVGMTDGNHRVTTVQVQVFLPLIVPHPASFRAHGRNIE